MHTALLETQRKFIWGELLFKTLLYTPFALVFLFIILWKVGLSSGQPWSIIFNLPVLILGSAE